MASQVSKQSKDQLDFFSENPVELDFRARWAYQNLLLCRFRADPNPANIDGLLFSISRAKSALRSKKS